jgi:hypothetical protein
MANVLKQYTSTVVKKCKQAKTLDDCEAIFLNGLKFAKTYKSIEQKHADIQQEESNLFLDFCMDD